MMPDSLSPNGIYHNGKTARSNYIVFAVTVVCFLLLSGCMFSDLKKEIQEEKNSYSLYGRIKNIEQVQSTVYVMLYAQVEGRLQLDCYVLPDETGTFAFILSPGTYVVAGFEDSNANARHDPGEPAGAWGAPDRIAIAGGAVSTSGKRVLADYDFELTPGPFPLAQVEASVANNANLAETLIKLGQPASWEDSVFGQEHAKNGFWKPMTFLRQHGVGIYFMAPYDPDKIPVLFVHGAAGTPRDFRTLAASLDAARFQPWVYYYPSGLRLNTLSTALNNIVKRLQKDHGFERMAVVSHSMGGLVARSFIVKHTLVDGKKTVKAFVSFSSPWGGVRMAAEGVAYAPEAIPSWYDVDPRSDFIAAIFDASLRAAGVPHYLIFGFRGDCSLFMANNDGSVEVSSLLDVRAQDDAVFVRGLNEDHMNILESPKASQYLTMALQAAF